jgi:hypothetical protein
MSYLKRLPKKIDLRKISESFRNWICTVTNMGRAFASNKNAKGICDRCGLTYPLKRLKNERNNKNETNLLVCPECVDPDHPQNWIGSVDYDDPQALRNPRADTGKKAGNEGDSIRYEFETDTESLDFSISDGSWSADPNSLILESNYSWIPQVVNRDALVAKVGDGILFNSFKSTMDASKYKVIKCFAKLVKETDTSNWIGRVSWNRISDMPAPVSIKEIRYRTNGFVNTRTTVETLSPHLVEIGDMVRLESTTFSVVEGNWYYVYKVDSPTLFWLGMMDDYSTTTGTPPYAPDYGTYPGGTMHASVFDMDTRSKSIPRPTFEQFGERYLCMTWDMSREDNWSGTINNMQMQFIDGGHENFDFELTIPVSGDVTMDIDYIRFEER